MGDRTTSWTDCPKCKGKDTLECYEALSSNMKDDHCSKCGYHVDYIFEEKDGVIHVTKIDPPKSRN